MAYADQDRTGETVTGIVVSVLIILAVGYVLVSGLAYSAAKTVLKKVTTVDIKDEPKPPPPPPPPPKDNLPPPPIVAPPPPVNISVAPPTIQTVEKAPPPAPVVVPVVAPPAPAAPSFTPKAPVPRSNPGGWATTDDYPNRAMREGVQGTTGFRLTVGPDGRVTSCEITSSSGSAELDNATCALTSRRARFTPATDGEGHPTTGSYSNKVRWVIPKD